jgi:hypothetical protein
VFKLGRFGTGVLRDYFDAQERRWLLTGSAAAVAGWISSIDVRSDEQPVLKVPRVS